MKKNTCDCLKWEWWNRNWVAKKFSGASRKITMHIRCQNIIYSFNTSSLFLVVGFWRMWSSSFSASPGFACNEKINRVVLKVLAQFGNRRLFIGHTISPTERCRECAEMRRQRAGLQTLIAGDSPWSFLGKSGYRWVYMNRLDMYLKIIINVLSGTMRVGFVLPRDCLQEIMIIGLLFMCRRTVPVLYRYTQ